MSVIKAIILARVSTREQEEGHSIQAQLQRLREYCIRKNLVVLQEFTIIESSKALNKGERKEFNAMLDFCRKQKEPIAIVSDAVDRIQRSFKESVLLDELIRKDKIELHFYREGMVIGKNASASDIMRWDFSVMGAKSYVLQLSENVKRSLEWKIRNGECIGMSPVGYLNARDVMTGKSIVIPDPAMASVVQKLFIEYSTGLYTIGEITKKSYTWGLRSKKGLMLTKSNVHKMIQNRFYYGEMEIKGNIYRHNYEPLITKDLYDTCQQVRLGWDKKPFQYGGKDYIFRGLIKCATSGNTVSSDTKKGVYTYLAVSNPDDSSKKLYIKEEEVLKQIEAVFKNFYLPNDVLQEVCNHLKNSNESEKRYHKEAVSEIRKKHTLVCQKIERLTELLLENVIQSDVYQQKRISLLQERDVLDIRIKEHERGDDGFTDTLFTLLSLASRAYELFISSSNSEKRELINFVFSNLQLRGQKLEYSLHSPFNYFTQPKKVEEWLGC